MNEITARVNNATAAVSASLTRMEGFRRFMASLSSHRRVVEHEVNRRCDERPANKDSSDEAESEPHQRHCPPRHVDGIPTNRPTADRTGLTIVAPFDGVIANVN